MKHRRVYHFGFTFLYNGNKADLNGPPAKLMPDVCLKLIDKILSANLTNNPLDQLTINVYEPGQGVKTLFFWWTISENI